GLEDRSLRDGQRPASQGSGAQTRLRKRKRIRPRGRSKEDGASLCRDGSGVMIRCVRIWTGSDGNSRFEEGHLDLEEGKRGDLLSVTALAKTISFQETA